MRRFRAAASILALALSVALVGEFAVQVGIFEFVGLVGVLSVLSVYIFVFGGRPPKEEKVFDVPIFSTSLKQRCQVDYSPVLVQGSGEHGAVSGVPVGAEQASRRVDLFGGAKIEAAAAFAGTLCSQPGKLDALRLVRSREGKGVPGSSDVLIIIRFMMWLDMMVGTFMIQCTITFWTSRILFRVFVSLTTQSVCVADSVGV